MKSALQFSKAFEEQGAKRFKHLTLHWKWNYSKTHIAF